jgi:hypothetical protein
MSQRPRNRRKRNANPQECCWLWSFVRLRISKREVNGKMNPAQISLSPLHLFRGRRTKTRKFHDHWPGGHLKTTISYFLRWCAVVQQFSRVVVRIVYSVQRTLPALFFRFQIISSNNQLNHKLRTNIRFRRKPDKHQQYVSTNTFWRWNI